MDHYNNIRLTRPTGYITRKDMLAGRRREIHAERDRKLEAARKQRQLVASKAFDVPVAPRCDALRLVIGPVQAQLGAGGAEA